MRLAPALLLALAACSGESSDPAAARRDFLAQFRQVAAFGRGCDEAMRLGPAGKGEPEAARAQLASDAHAVCLDAATTIDAMHPPEALGSAATAATTAALDACQLGYRERADGRGERATADCIDAWRKAAPAAGVRPDELR